MRIGLLRHFKVDCAHKRLMTSEEFRDWSEKYEHSRILKKHVEMYGIQWDICYASDIPRAVATAQEVYSGNIIIDKLLREVDNAPFLHTERFRLPFWLWHVCGRFAWLFKSKSQPETIEGTKRRIREFLDSIDWSQENILIVCHGFMMFNLCMELFKLGFHGTKLRRVRNGVLYQYIGPRPKLKNGRLWESTAEPEDGKRQEGTAEPENGKRQEGTAEPEDGKRQEGMTEPEDGEDAGKGKKKGISRTIKQKFQRKYTRLGR